MKNTEKTTSRLYKTVTAISVVLSLAVIVFALLQIFEVWNKAVNVCMLLMGMAMLCQAYLQRNNSRKLSYFSIATSVFIFICAFIVFFVR